MTFDQLSCCCCRCAAGRRRGRVVAGAQPRPAHPRRQRGRLGPDAGVAVWMAGSFFTTSTTAPPSTAQGQPVIFVPEFVPGSTPAIPHHTTWNVLPIGQGAHPVLPRRRRPQHLAGGADGRADAALASSFPGPPSPSASTSSTPGCWPCRRA